MFCRFNSQSIEEGGLEVQARVHKLLKTDENGNTCFLPIHGLKKVLKDNHFDLYRFQQQLEDIVSKWNKELFDEQEAELWELEYHIEPNNEEEDEASSIANGCHRPKSTKQVITETNAESKKSSRKKRKREPRPAYLPNQTKPRSSPKWTDDAPSPESNQLSPQTGKSSSTPKRKRKPRTVNLPNQTRPRDPQPQTTETPEPHSDSSQKSERPPGRKEVWSTPGSDGRRNLSYRSPGYIETDTSDIASRIALSEIPHQADNSPPRYNGRGPDTGRFTDGGRVVKRIKWTDREVQALRAGVIKYGVGNWVRIKNDYEMILRNRTSVMLKDKYRNMVRKGEIHTNSSHAK